MEMKNMGLPSGLQLLCIVAGILSYARGELQSHAMAPPRRGKRPADHPERGDVPGWVMITLMSAVLVAALLALAGPALETMFNQAMDKVGN
jgi:type VI protein secretion system component VasF